MKTSSSDKANQDPKKTIMGTLIIIIVLIFGALILYPKLTAPKADYNGFQAAINNFVSNNKDIVSIKELEHNKFNVTVKKTWNSASKDKKLRFCRFVHNSIYDLATQYHVIKNESDSVYLTFYDNSGTKVAEQNIVNFTILK